MPTICYIKLKISYHSCNSLDHGSRNTVKVL